MQGFKVFLLILLLIPSTVLTQEFKRSFISWGTNLDFVVNSDFSEHYINSVILEVQSIPRSLELIFDLNNNNSELYRFNKLEANKEMIVSPDLIFLLNESLFYNRTTKGYFDPTGSPYIKNKNNDISYLNERCRGFSNLIINSNKSSIIKREDCSKIDLDGIAEGYAISLMLLKFKEKGFKDVLINFGGNVSTLSDRIEWRVSIKDPYGEYSVNSTYDLNNLSVSTSSQYSKTIENNNVVFSRIFDPIQRMIKPEKNISFSVIGDNPIYSDAISTGLQAMPLEVALTFLKETKSIKALVLNKDDGKKTEVLYNNFP